MTRVRVMTNVNDWDEDEGHNLSEDAIETLFETIRVATLTTRLDTIESKGTWYSQDFEVDDLRVCSFCAVLEWSTFLQVEILGDTK